MTKKLRKPLSIILSLMMILSVFTIIPVTSASAATTGSFESLTWNIDDDGILTFSGSGALPQSAFAQNGDVKKVIINDSVTELGAFAFTSCPNLTEVDIQNPSVSLKGSYHFSNTGVTTVTLPEGMTTIPQAMFRSCTALTTVDLPSTITSIEDYAFWGSGLQSISVPEGATYNSTSFQTDSLQSLTLEGSSPMTFTGGEFTFLSDAATVYIPEGSTYVYSTTTATLYAKDPSDARAQGMLDSAQEYFNGCIEDDGYSPEEALADVNDMFGDLYGMNVTTEGPFTVTLNEGDTCEAVFGGATIGKYAPAPTTYTVTWKNYDGSVLETDADVAEGATPEYNGNEPTKAEDDYYTYSFAGWSPEVTAVTGDVTYTATFDATPKVVDTTKYRITFANSITGSGTISTTLPCTLPYTEWLDLAGLWKYDPVPDATVADGDEEYLSLKDSNLTILKPFTGTKTINGILEEHHTVTVTCELDVYSITDESVNGTVTASVNDTDVTEAAPDDAVLLNVAPTEGYQFKSITATCAKNGVEDFSDLVALMGDAVADGYDGEFDGYTFKVEDGKFVIYNGSTLFAELSESDVSDFQVGDVTYVESGDEGWYFTLSDNKITELYWQNNTTSDYLFTNTFESTGTLSLVELALTTVTEGSQYSFTMPNKPVTVTAEFEEGSTPAPTTHTVTWKNWDGSVLETDADVAEGATPEYNGNEPTKPEDEENTYEFAGWTPDIAEVTADAEYTATFTATGKYVAVAEMINALPAEVTAEDADAVKAARDAYEALSDEQKALVDADTLAKLAAAEYTLDPTELVNTSTLNGELISTGSRLTINPSAEGGLPDYTFQIFYKRNNSKNWTELKNATSFKVSVAGDLIVKVIVTDKAGNSAEVILNTTVRDPLENTSTAPGVDLGQRAVIYGSATGGAGGYTYTYYYKRNTARNWTLLGEENTTAESVGFKTSKSGAYDVKVIVTDSEGKSVEKLLTLGVRTASELKNNTTISATTVAPGTRVYVNTAAEGGTGAYSWSVRFKRPSAKNWTELTLNSNGIASFAPKSFDTYEVIAELIDADGTSIINNFTVNVMDPT